MSVLWYYFLISTIFFSFSPSLLGSVFFLVFVWFLLLILLHVLFLFFHLLYDRSFSLSPVCSCFPIFWMFSLLFISSIICLLFHRSVFCFFQSNPGFVSYLHPLLPVHILFLFLHLAHVPCCFSISCVFCSCFPSPVYSLLVSPSLQCPFVVFLSPLCSVFVSPSPLCSVPVVPSILCSVIVSPLSLCYLCSCFSTSCIFCCWTPSS